MVFVSNCSPSTLCVTRCSKGATHSKSGSSVNCFKSSTISYTAIGRPSSLDLQKGGPEGDRARLRLSSSHPALTGRKPSLTTFMRFCCCKCDTLPTHHLFSPCQYDIQTHSVQGTNNESYLLHSCTPAQTLN